MRRRMTTRKTMTTIHWSSTKRSNLTTKSCCWKMYCSMRNSIA